MKCLFKILGSPFIVLIAFLSMLIQIPWIILILPFIVSEYVDINISTPWLVTILNWWYKL